MFEPLVLLLVALAAVGAPAVALWPEKGLLARWKAIRRRNQRVLREDILKHLQKSEIEGRQPTLESVAGVIHSTPDEAFRLLEQLREHDLLTLEGGEFKLTGAGRRYALHVIRAHRLWERYLADETGLSETEWHRRAERTEHDLSADDLDLLSAQLHHPVYDPHGDPIPTRSGQMGAQKDFPLTAAAAGERFRVTHLEDEPEVVYAQLVAEGLRPGLQLQVIELEPERISFWSDGEEHSLAPLLARNVFVAKVERQRDEPSRRRLSDLKPGEQARILGLSPSCRGVERRRFMDLGILPGTAVTAELEGAGGDPVAYRVRGAMIALRREQAGSIYIEANAS